MQKFFETNKSILLLCATIERLEEPLSSMKLHQAQLLQQRQYMRAVMFVEADAQVQCDAIRKILCHR